MSDLREILRKQRADRGMTQDQTGSAIQVSGSLIAAIESGRLIPQPDTATRLDELFGTGDEIQRAAEVARDEARAPWLRPWTDHEERATMLRCFELDVIPGLLQTPDYARRLLTDVGPVSDVDGTLAARLARQDVITRSAAPARLVAVVDEDALRRQVGSPEVMAEQLQAVLAACELPNVWLHVVPAHSGAYAGLNGPFVLGTVNGRVLGFLDSHLGGQVIDQADAIRVLEEAWEGVRSYALPTGQSHDLIAKVAESWT
ncbi:helix-turn-helix domain-containing protein [Plantactinospora soyae]|uniref:Transcriptional regulator with XRE-family HTH domain n=1 Tax=Plantactinospora soyae TaxID=1544732 RepID=A0A927MF77_9ACTN|nr:Scr1 family TA system antitoxin-like transcriptional regulator [Plantactinospora soyae]MBE1490030.1 transcriptional regulator with XRE-family HTH domain [Plantactinospora soyae]